MTWNSNSSKLISSLVRLNIFSAHTKWQSWERRCLVEQWKSPPGKGFPGKHESIRSNFSPLFTGTCREYPLLSFIIRNPQIHWSMTPWNRPTNRQLSLWSLKGLNVRHRWCRSGYWHLALLHHLTTQMSGCWVWFPAVGLSSIKTDSYPSWYTPFMRLMHHEFRCETISVDQNLGMTSMP